MIFRTIWNVDSNLKLPGAGVTDIERLDAVDADPVAVVALRRALRVGVLDRREARLGLPELGVPRAVGDARLKNMKGGIVVVCWIVYASAQRIPCAPYV